MTRLCVSKKTYWLSLRVCRTPVPLFRGGACQTWIIYIYIGISHTGTLVGVHPTIPKFFTAKIRENGSDWKTFSESGGLPFLGLSRYCYPSSHHHGSVENGCTYNIGFLSFRVIFHFHDYGIKGKLFRGEKTHCSTLFFLRF